MKKFGLLTVIILCTLSIHAQQWEIEYGDPDSYALLYQYFINAEDKNLIIGKCGEDYTNYKPLVILVDKDGNYDSHIIEDEQLEMFSPSDICQLDNGNYFMVGTKNKSLVAAIIDADFNAINVKTYKYPDGVLSLGGGRLLLDDDGTLVFCGQYKYQDVYGTRLKPYFYRLDENADSLSCRFITAEMLQPDYIDLFECFKVLKNPSDEGIVVQCIGINGFGSILLFDDDFNYLRGFILQPGFRQFFHTYTSDHWLSDHTLSIFGRFHNQEKRGVGMAEVNLDGTFERSELIYHKQDTTIQTPNHCMAYVNDSTIYLAIYQFEYLGGPNYSEILLCSSNMEILGKVEFYKGDYIDYINYIPKFIIPLSDGGCLFNMQLFSNLTYGKLIKLAREDFNPIPLKVKEVPQETTRAFAYPNPARDDLNIDISGLSKSEEHRIRIVDAMGHICLDRIIRGEGNMLTLGISSLPSGMYVYSIYNTEKEVSRGKFVKE